MRSLEPRRAVRPLAAVWPTPQEELKGLRRWHDEHLVPAAGRLGCKAHDNGYAFAAGVSGLPVTAVDELAAVMAGAGLELRTAEQAHQLGKPHWQSLLGSARQTALLAAGMVEGLALVRDDAARRAREAKEQYRGTLDDSIRALAEKYRRQHSMAGAAPLVAAALARTGVTMTHDTVRKHLSRLFGAKGWRAD